MKSPNWDDRKVDEGRAYITSSAAREAFDALVAFGIRSSAYFVSAGDHGKIRDLRFELRGRPAFAFIPNRTDLLFYVRMPGVRILGATTESLERLFADVKETSSGEFTVRVTNAETAQQVIDRILSQAAPEHRSISAILDRVTREDVDLAIADIIAGKSDDQFGQSRLWDVAAGEHLLAPKRVVGVAAARIAGRALTPKDFSGGTDSKCHEVIEKLGLEIVPKGDLLAVKEMQEAKALQALERDKEIPETEKKQVVASRRGQGRFRRHVAAIEKNGCRLTGVKELVHLRASHIKPWRFASNQERLDGNNGLMLAPHVDHLFDEGFLSFNDDGTLIISVALQVDVAKAWSIKQPEPTRDFNFKQRNYLAYHRKEILRR